MTYHLPPGCLSKACAVRIGHRLYRGSGCEVVPSTPDELLGPGRSKPDRGYPFATYGTTRDLGRLNAHRLDRQSQGSLVGEGAV